MPLLSVFRKAACAGIAAIATMSAHAELQSFPLAEDVLIQNGLPPEKARDLVERIAGTRSVRVFNDDTAMGLVNGLRDIAVIARTNGNSEKADQYAGVLMNVMRLFRDIRSTPDYSLPVKDRKIPFLQSLDAEDRPGRDAECYIKWDERLTARKLLVLTTTIPGEFIEHDPMPLKTMLMLNFMHELDHCKEGTSELRADRSAISSIPELKPYIAEFHDNGDIAEKWVQTRILSPVFGGHSTALFIDDDMNAKAGITINDVAAVYDQAGKLLASEKVGLKDALTQDGRPRFVRVAEGFERLLQKHPEQNLLTRYMQLYILAAKAIAPSLTAGIAIPVMTVSRTGQTPDLH